jgi:hypothetical protein
VRVPVDGWTPGTVAFGDETDATFATEFDAPVDGTLRFDGIATLATIRIDGAVVAESQSMWVPVEVPLAAGHHKIEVHCRALAPELGVPRKPRARWRQKVAGNNNLRWFRTSLNGRAPGFAPGPPVVGLWRPVWFTAGEVSFDVRARVEGEDGIVTVRTALPDGTRVRLNEVSAIVADGGRILMASRTSMRSRSTATRSAGVSDSGRSARPGIFFATACVRRSMGPISSFAARYGRPCPRARCARRWKRLATMASTPSAFLAR